MRIPFIAEITISIERALRDRDEERADTLRFVRGTEILRLRVELTREIVERHLQAMEDLRVFCARRFNAREPA